MPRLTLSSDVDRNVALTVGLALLAVAALALAAATLDTAVQTDGGGFGIGPTDRPGLGSGSDGSFGGSAGAGGSSPRYSLCVPFLTRPWVIAAIALAFVAAAALVYWRTRTLILPAAFTLAVGLPFVFVHALLTGCEPSEVAEPSLAASTWNLSGVVPSGGGSTGLGGPGQAVSTPSALLGIVLIVAIVGSVALLFFSTGDAEGAESERDPDSPPDSDVDVAAVGRAAGAAADRIEDAADVENEVYRAWVEMTEHLDVSNPRSSTPAEFAAAAVDAGMAPEDVDELTALFESVRYGGARATDERETRAVAALRRIEATYAEAEQ
jgi:hypothetical protein